MLTNKNNPETHANSETEHTPLKQVLPTIINLNHELKTKLELKASLITFYQEEAALRSL